MVQHVINVNIAGKYKKSGVLIYYYKADMTLKGNKEWRAVKRMVT